MATLPVITDVWRCTLNWTGSSTIQPRNVFHMLAPSGTASSFSTAFNTASTAAGPHLADGWSDSFTCSSVDLLKLDGSSPTVTAAINTLTGQSTGDKVPASSVVLSFKTGQRGSRGRGRMFQGPNAESLIANGAILTTAATNIVTAWANWAASMATNGWTLVVASYKHADQHAVTSMRCDTILGTQRRRQERLEP